MKFDDVDKRFIGRRNSYFAAAHDLTPKFAVDNWGLFAGVVPIASMLAKYEILKSTLSVPGHVLEFGVFNGANLLFLAKALKVLAPNDLKTLYGFDSWKGLTEFDAKDGDASADKGRYAGAPDTLNRMIELHELGDTVRLIDGLIETTLPAFLEQNPHHIFSLIYLDTDLYASTLLALKLCWPRLAPGGVMVFDEGYDDHFKGEGTAMNEFISTIPGQFRAESSPYARQPMLWLRKL